jgi:hypothetical protein
MSDFVPIFNSKKFNLYVYVDFSTQVQTEPKLFLLRQQL